MYDATIGKFVTPNFDYTRCPGCTSAYSEENKRVDYKIKKYSGEKVYSSICEDCHQDIQTTGKGDSATGKEPNKEEQQSDFDLL